MFKTFNWGLKIQALKLHKGVNFETKLLQSSILIF